MLFCKNFHEMFDLFDFSINLNSCIIAAFKKYIVAYKMIYNKIKREKSAGLD